MTDFYHDKSECEDAEIKCTDAQFHFVRWVILYLRADDSDIGQRFSRDGRIFQLHCIEELCLGSADVAALRETCDW